MESLLKNNNDCRWDRIDVYYYEYGSLVMLYEDAERAARAYKMLRDAYYENKQLTVLLLPTIQVYNLFLFLFQALLNLNCMLLRLHWFHQTFVLSSCLWM